MTCSFSVSCFCKPWFRLLSLLDYKLTIEVFSEPKTWPPVKFFRELLCFVSVRFEAELLRGLPVKDALFMCLAVVVYPDYVALLAALTVTKDAIVLAGASTLIAVYYLCCFWLRVVSSLSTSAYMRWALFGLICCCMLPFREAINFLDTLIFSWFSIWITCCIILGEVGRLGKAYCSVVR